MNHQRKTLLTIDDEAGLRRSFRSYFEDIDFMVLEAENGRIGIDIFRKERPDIVLVDLRMPEMDGLEVTRILHREAPDTPVIVVSGTGILADAVEAIREGAWDYVTKPIADLQALEHVVNRMLERARLLKENRAYQEDLEKLVEERTSELRSSEEKYRTIFNATSEAIIIYHMESNRILEINQAMLDMFGYSYEEMLNMTAGDMSAGEAPFTKNDLMLKFRQTITAAPQFFEWLGRKKDGSTMWLEVSLSKFKIAGQGRIIAVLRNISERKLAEQEKNVLEMRLTQAQKMESIGTLAGGIAHDFNNILTAILGYGELVKLSLPAGSEPLAQQNEVIKACERAKELVQQILSFSRQAGQKQHPTKIHLIVKEALKLLRASIPTIVDIRQNICSQSTMVMADPTQVHQVIMNLCTNAYHAMREKGGVLAVALQTVSLTENDAKVIGIELLPGKYLRLEVSDSGHGMSREVQAKIFDPYYTTKKTGEGTGLGLSVVHGIIKNHGGQITVYSEIGKGSTFHVYLPCTITASDKSTDHESAEEIPHGSERVLIVDDEAVIARMTKTMLEGLGYQVSAHASSPEALRVFTQQPEAFDLVITDMTMPDMTGIELTQKLFAIRADIPIILCTGFSELINEEKAKELGIREFIMKPVFLTTLAQSIRRALAK